MALYHISEYQILGSEESDALPDNCSRLQLDFLSASYSSIDSKRDYPSDGLLRVACSSLEYFGGEETSSPEDLSLPGLIAVGVLPLGSQTAPVYCRH